MEKLLEDLGLDWISLNRLMKKISPFFRQSREILKKKYFKEYIPEDANNLQLFLGNFLYKLKPEVAILAVGSSTFPKSHWREIKKINQQDPSVKIPETYRGIDLLVMPEYEIKNEKFEKYLKNSLNSWELEPLDLGGIISEMEWCRKIDGKYSPLVTYNKENKGFSTSLPNKRILNIIFSKEDYFKTAEEKIREERKSGNPFCIVHRNS